MTPILQVKGVTKRFGGLTANNDISFDVAEREILSVIGPNGAGKSTLLGLIARLLAADRGTVTVDGLDVATTAGEELSRRLSVLKQDNSITARLTVRDLVAFGRYPHSRGRLGEADHAMIGRALSYLGLEPIADRFLDELSGGQRQRAYVAMVLAQDTDYMLFDEPLASLDIRHAVSMMHLLRDASRRFGKAVVVVLHDINIAGNFSDRIIGMKEGRVLCHGSAGEVMTGANLTAIYDIPIAVHRLEGQFVTTYALPEGADGA